MVSSHKACPHCHTRYLERTLHEGHELDICPGCGGIWCEPESWDADKLGKMPLDELLAHGGPQVIPKMTDLPCPRCKLDMTEYRIPEIQNLEIDQCPGCEGVWFDHGEWEHLAALRDWQAHKDSAGAEMEWKHWFFQLLLGMPVEFNVRPRRFPIVTVSLIVICTLMFIIQLITPGNLIEFANWPQHLYSSRGLLCLFTYQFLHGSWFHLIGNMYLLYILGDNVEDVMGKWHFLAFYLICGALAGIPHDIIGMQMMEDPMPVVGASGAIAAVIGAYFLLFREAKLTFMLVVFQFKVPAWAWLGGWFALQLIGAYFDPTSIKAGVDWFAHISGFVLGAAWVIVQRRQLVESHPLLSLLDSKRIR